MGILFYFAILLVTLVIFIRRNNKKKWGSVDTNNEISVKKKIVVITGASAGVGKGTALEFARRHAHVILACRNVKKAKDVVTWIRNRTFYGELVCMELDLASLKSVKQFAEEFKSKYDKLDILVNNAGVAFPPEDRQKTADGFEIHMGVNHLGHFLLTNLLLQPLKRAAPSRIVTVSSDGHSWDGPLDIDNLMAENRIFEGFHPANPLYCRSKLANALFNLELSKKLRGSGVTTYAVHPGVVQTDIAQNLKFPLSWMMTILTPVLTLFLRSIVEGAQTTIHCALNRSLENESGKMYRDCRYWPESERITLTDEDARRLWEESTKLVKPYL